MQLHTHYGSLCTCAEGSTVHWFWARCMHMSILYVYSRQRWQGLAVVWREIAAAQGAQADTTPSNKPHSALFPITCCACISALHTVCTAQPAGHVLVHVCTTTDRASSNVGRGLPQCEGHHRERCLHSPAVALQAVVSRSGVTVQSQRVSGRAPISTTEQDVH